MATEPKGWSGNAAGNSNPDCSEPLRVDTTMILAIVVIVVIYVAALTTNQNPGELGFELLVGLLILWVIVYWVFKGIQSLLQPIFGG